MRLRVDPLHGVRAPSAVRLECDRSEPRRQVCSRERHDRRGAPCRAAALVILLIVCFPAKGAPGPWIGASTSRGACMTRSRRVNQTSVRPIGLARLLAVLVRPVPFQELLEELLGLRRVVAVADASRGKELGELRSLRLRASRRATMRAIQLSARSNRFQPASVLAKLTSRHLMWFGGRWIRGKNALTNFPRADSDRCSWANCRQ